MPGTPSSARGPHGDVSLAAVSMREGRVGYDYFSFKGSGCGAETCSACPRVGEDRMSSSHGNCPQRVFM